MITEDQQHCINWLRAHVSHFNGVFCLMPDYQENNPVYFGSNLDEMLELALEDYADWDET